MGLFNKFKAPPSNPPPQKKVLIVEDDKTLADALEIKFSHAGFIVFKAENGQSGLEVTLAQKPDIIILDLMMPVMDGTSMIRKLRENPDFKKIPVIVLTNAGNVDKMREMKLYYGVSDFFIKSNTSLDSIINNAKNVLLL